MFPAGRFLVTDVDTLGATVAPGNAVVRMNKLSALGRAQQNGLVPKLGGIEIVATLGINQNGTNQDGNVAGARAFEVINRIQLSPNQWIKKFSHDLSAKALRRLVNKAMGREAHLVPGALNDAIDATATPVIGVIIPFWDEGSIEPGDTCPDVVNVGDGTLELGVAHPPIDGFSAEQLTSARVMAYYFWGKPGVPVFRVMQERAIESQTRFRLNLQGDRLKRAFLMVNGSQGSSTTHLAGSYDETVTVQLTLNGDRVIEDARIDDLTRHWNNMHHDAAIDESITVPELCPLIADHRKMKSTKAPNGAGDSWVEFSADPRDTATGTGTTSNVITDELFAARPSSAPTEAYRAASATRVRGTLVHKTVSKVEGVSALKADALPLLEALPRTTSRKA